MLRAGIDPSTGKSSGVLLEERDQSVQEDRRGELPDDQTDEAREANRTFEERESQ